MNKGRTFTVEILSPQEATALIAACGARSPTGIRNRALLTLLYRGGLRIGEVLKLAVRDYQEEPNGATVRIRNGKKTLQAKASPKGRAGPRSTGVGWRPG